MKKIKNIVFANVRRNTQHNNKCKDIPIKIRIYGD